MKESTELEYRPLITDDGEVAHDLPFEPQKKMHIRYLEKLKPTYWTLVLILLFQALIILAGLILLFVQRSSHRPGVLWCIPSSEWHWTWLTQILAPALEVVENKIKVYHVGFPGDLSPFQVPSSPELDDAWEDLYSFGISKITKEQAAKLPNKTQAIPGEPDWYIAELDVFHNLHCLNMVRKALDPVYYPDWNISHYKNASEHVSHCIDWIRQSIMCHADTSVIVWQWEDWANGSIVKGDIAHTCRNFEKVQDWAKARILDRKFDPSVKIVDDIVIPILQEDDL